MMLLRDVRDEDLAILFEQQSEPAASRMAAFPPRDRDSFFRHWRSNVTSWKAGDQRCVGYWLGERFWGQGLATAELGRFVQLDVARPLYAVVATRNVGSIRVLEKCGFTHCEDANARAALLTHGEDAAVLELTA